MALDLTGTRFGKLVVEEQLGLRSFPKGKAFYVRCRCDCGGIIDVQQSNLVRMRAPSCGCTRRATAGPGGTKHPLYSVWSTMIGRCTNPANRSFADYGKRGVAVCKRWLTGDGDLSGLECFVSDMGARPPGGMLERMNNDLGYQPGNCMWADRKTQNSNKRSNIIVAIGQQRLTVAEWARRLGRSEFLIYRRISRGWPPERAVIEPPVRTFPKRSS